MIATIRALTVAAFTFIAFPAAAECILPTAPALPDGNTASKDDMIAASRAVKTYQAELTDFRGCLENERVAIEGTDDESNEARTILSERYNGSVDTEEAVAMAFNAQIRAYNAANPKE